MDMTTVFAPIMKTAPQPDGSILVYGKATGSDLDLDQQRCSPTWLARAVPEWFKIGNIREQHDPHRAVGKATEHDVREDGHYITAKIVDPVAKAKVEAGVFTGFSIGVKNYRLSKSADAPNGVIEDGRIVEVSIVDAPCLPTATLTVCKSATPGMEINAADFDEERGLVRCEELDENPSQPLVVKSARDTAAKENDVPTLADTLAPEALEKLAAAVDPADAPTLEKTAEGDEAAVEAQEEATQKAADAVSTPAGGDESPVLDVDTTKSLVADLLTKAEGDEPAPDMVMAPPSDEALANAAIDIIARLIQSEAGSMVGNPEEDGDIRCLLEAVAAVRWFLRRERMENNAGGESDSAPYAYSELAATPDAEKADEQEPVVEKTAEQPLVVVSDPPSPELVAAVVKAAATGDPVEAPTSEAIPEPVVTKTIDADAAKAVAVEDTPTNSDVDALVKAFAADLSKADSPLRSAFNSMIAESTETIAEALEDTRARLVKVENMAVPGGPALRRTEVERTSARKNDLMIEAARLRSLEANTHDQTLVKGYRLQADALEAEIRAISA